MLKPTRQAVAFAVRTTAASIVALLICEWIGLASPHWAAMTVWLVAQPTRGMALAKGAWRLVGTGVGAVAAAGLLLLAPWPPLFVAGLALWTGTASLAASVLRAFRAYGALLAGITGALLSILAFSHPEEVSEVGMTRLLCVVVGVIVSALNSAIFVPGADRQQVLRRCRTLSADALELAAGLLRSGRSEGTTARERRLVIDAADLAVVWDQLAAGSARMRGQLAFVRAVITSNLALIAAARAVAAHVTQHGAASPAIAPLADRLDAAAASARDGRPLEAPPQAELADRTVRHHLDAIAAAIAHLQHDLEGVAGGRAVPAATALRRHHEWRIARTTGLRSAIGVALVGTIWLATGWEGGPSMLLGTALLSCVFSTSDDPARFIRGSVLGGFLAVAASLLFRVVLAPGPTEPLLLAAMLVPFLLAGGLVIANRPTVYAGTEFTMLFLLLVQPGLAEVGPPGRLFLTGAGTAAGFAAALLVYTFVLPTNPERRLAGLIDEIVSDLEALARTDVAVDVEDWRAGAGGRVLRLALRIGKAGEHRLDALHGGLAAWTIGMALLRLRSIREAGVLPAEADGEVAGALDALRDLSREPLAVCARVRTGAAKLQGLPEAAAALDEIADELEAEAPFFARNGSARPPG